MQLSKKKFKTHLPKAKSEGVKSEFSVTPKAMNSKTLHVFNYICTGNTPKDIFFMMLP